MNEIVARKFENFNEYCVIFENGEETGVSDEGCYISCGISEFENVGIFIDDLNKSGLKPKEIAGELKKLSSLHKATSRKNDDVSSAFVMFSIVHSDFRSKVCKYLRKEALFVSNWRTNPNSGNKINMIIM